MNNYNDVLDLKGQVPEADYRRSKIHPKKLALWLSLASIVMMFTALTSAYIVRMAAGNWLEFSIPNIFYWNTGVIVLSSVTFHAAYIAFKRGAEGLFRLLLGATFILGIGFVVLQVMGWLQLVDAGVPLGTNPSGDFVYAISAMHAAHIIVGVAILAVCLVAAFVLPFRRTPARQLRLELSLTYWHFVDALWLYLIIFLSYQR